MNKLRLHKEIQNNKIYLHLSSKEFILRENILSVSKCPLPIAQVNVGHILLLSLGIVKLNTYVKLFVI